MSNQVIFDCFALVPKENLKSFKDLFLHSVNETKAFNFGTMEDWSQTELPSGNVALEFDCLNTKGIYHGWYKTEHKNIEAYCKELGVVYLSAFCNRGDEKDVDSEVLYYEPEKGISLHSFNVYHKNIDVQDGVDYYEKRTAKKESELC